MHAWSVEILILTTPSVHTIEWHSVILQLTSQPVLDSRHSVEYTFLKFKNRAA